MQSPPGPESDPHASANGANSADRTIDDYDWRQVTDFLYRRQTLLAAVLLVFIATRLWMLLAFQVQQADTGLYAVMARKGIDRQLVAYRDFEVYYPPVAWWLMALPRFFDSATYPETKLLSDTVDSFFGRYYAFFHIELFFADVVCLGLMWAIGRRMSPVVELALPAAYILLTIAQPHLLYDRLDIVLLMFFLLTIYCWLRSLEPSPAATRWACASYLFLGLGISFKVVPLVCVPYLLLADLLAWGSAWRFAALVLSLLVGGLGPFLVHMPAAGWGVFSLFQFHAQRDMQMESIWSSAMLVASAVFGVPSSVVLSEAGYNLTGDWSGRLKLIAGVSLLATGAAFGLWALLGAKRFDRRLALDLAILVLINSTVLSAVFSPQYLNWLLPLAVILALNIFPRSWALWCAFAVLVVAIVGISSWLFPHHYTEELVKLQTFPVVLSVTRSACLVGLALLLDVRFFARYGLVPWRIHGPAAEALAATG